MPTEFTSLIPDDSTGDTAVIDESRFNRRLGKRRAQQLMVHVKPAGQRKRLPFRARTQAALTNVSVSGGALTCHALRGVQMYGMLEIEGETGHALVRVQRLTRLGNGKVEYGVVLIDADPAMQRVFHGVGPNSNADADWRWMAAQ